MKILAIETSCDETSIALIEKFENKENKSLYKILAHETISQMNLHREWGGIYPTLSRREHEKNLIPLLHKVLLDSNLLKTKNQKKNLESFSNEVKVRDDNFIKDILGNEIELIERYPDLKENVFNFFSKYELSQKLDFIAVTNGPGLPPALWTGVNFAKIISILFREENKPIPIYPINHMEGHIIGAISKTKEQIVEISKINYPVINLLISGGHTELVVSDKNLSYKKIGETQDDAIGECFDKVARLLDLSYPGGPEIGKLANIGRKHKVKYNFKFPRPMINSKDLNFSFSGLKTHILYFVQKLKSNNNFSDEIKIEIATEFEETVKDILISKTKKAIIENAAQTLVVGGGVASNLFLREHFENLAKELKIETFISDKTLSTDNALMIALCAANQIENNIPPTSSDKFSAIGSKHYNVW